MSGSGTDVFCNVCDCFVQIRTYFISSWVRDELVTRGIRYLRDSYTLVLSSVSFVSLPYARTLSE